jgi:hypothetical protein
MRLNLFKSADYPFAAFWLRWVNKVSGDSRQMAKLSAIATDAICRR